MGQISQTGESGELGNREVRELMGLIFLCLLSFRKLKVKTIRNDIMFLLQFFLN